MWPKFQSKNYLLREAAADNVIVMLTCRGCWKRANYLAVDLVGLVGGHAPAHKAPFECSACGTDQHIKVRFHYPRPGDYGALRIRRPGPVKTVQTWRNVVLGEDF